MRRILYLLVLFSVISPITPAQNTYSTNFPLTENPISEGGRWINGKDTALDWCNVQTGNVNGAAHAFGVNFGTTTNCGAQSYGDPIAVLTGTWATTQHITATAFIAAGGPGTTFPEIELHTNMTLSAHNITGYEFDCGLFPPQSPGPNFSVGVGIVRWNGPLGNWPNNTNNGFTLIASDPTQVCARDGDVMEVVNLGAVPNNLRWYRNGQLILQVTDHTYTGGQPGIGMNTSMGSTYPLSGWRNFAVTDANPVVPPALPSNGIISNNGLAIDYRDAGFPQDKLFDQMFAPWPICQTISAYTGAPDAINTALTNCHNSNPVAGVVVLGAGTFNLSGAVLLPSGGNTVLRGQGAASTILIFSSNAGSTCAGAFVCVSGSGGSSVFRGANNLTETVHNVTAGLSQGSTYITLDSVSGITAGATSLIMNQCDTGVSGTNCRTGAETDNNGYYISSNAWTSGSFSSPPVLGSADSGEGPNGSSWRCQLSSCSASTSGYAWEVEEFLVLGVVGNVVQLNRPIHHPNWNTSLSPQVIANNLTKFNGLENFQIRVPNSGVAIQMSKCYKCWATGMSMINVGRGIVALGLINSVIENNYVYGLTTSGDQPGIGIHEGSNNLVANNICHRTSGCVFQDGPEDSDVFAYNYGVGLGSNSGSSGTLASMLHSHSAGNDFNYNEGNIGTRAIDDLDHGTHLNQGYFRNFFWGYDNWTNGGHGSFTIPSISLSTTQAGFGSRYGFNVANVKGIKGYPNVYMAPANSNAFGQKQIYTMGFQATSAGPPGDPLGQCSNLGTSTFTQTCWANYDTVHNATQFNTTEVSSSAPTYPNSVPTACTTANNCPASLIYTTGRPLWYPSTIPFPGNGYDVTGGNLGQCGGTLFTASQSGLPSTTASRCTGSGTMDTSAWAGHVNANPAMACYFSLGGLPDGSGPALTNFDANVCYGGNVIPPPSVPTGLTASVSGTSVTLNWNASTGTLTGYHVYRGTVSGGPYTLISSPTATTFVDSGLASGTYFYVVTAYNSSAESAKSNQVTATTSIVLLLSPVPTSLTFGSFTVGTSSHPQSVALINNSTAGSTITITSITFTGANPADYSETDTCSAPIAQGASCSVSVTFTPTASGSRAASLSVASNAPTVNVSVTGTGLNPVPVASLAPTSLTFASQATSSTSPAQTIVLTNTGTGSMTINSITITGTNAGDFGNTTSCGGTLAANASCNINVTFTPSATGTRTASVSVSDNAAGSPHTASLTGTGVAVKCAITGTDVLSGITIVCGP